MSAHTPGPWTFERHPEESQYFGNVIGHYELQVIRTISCQLRYGTKEEQEANAALIAAAPDMLDLLKTIENDGKQVPDWLWDRIQAVIAKATTKTLTHTQLGTPLPGSGTRPGPDSPVITEPDLSSGAESDASRSVARPGGLAASDGKERA